MVGTLFGVSPAEKSKTQVEMSRCILRLQLEGARERLDRGVDLALGGEGSSRLFPLGRRLVGPAQLGQSLGQAKSGLDSLGIDADRLFQVLNRFFHVSFERQAIRAVRNAPWRSETD